MSARGENALTAKGCTELGHARPVCVTACAATPFDRVGLLNTGMRVAGLVLVGLVVIPVALLMSVGRGHRRQRRSGRSLTLLCRTTLRALGVQVELSGDLRTGASLLVANHVSWLDILVLGATGPMRPVAKEEVGGWPIVGPLARRFGAIFVGRTDLRSLPEVVEEITAGLRRGQRIQVFPEATTRCGTGMDPFHRAAFQAAINAAVVVQPMAISYRDSAGRRMTAAAFVGDGELVSSLRSVLRMRGLRVQVQSLRVIPGAAVTGLDATDRRRVAAMAQRDIARKLAVPLVVRRRSAAVGATAPVDHIGRFDQEVGVTGGGGRRSGGDVEDRTAAVADHVIV
ncbi:1-acyl-sn-glycerol-3-phosphate acyltransferase [Nakamurella silvestris]|nr:1-acyl-sn-glycerol-3-phosphate acyltransferase [Nakamurella silvestris]